MPRFQDLQLAPEQPTAAQEELPEQMGSRVEPLQPGIYRFQMPKELLWEVLADMTLAFRDPSGAETERKGERVNCIFDAEHPLTIVQSPQDARNGESFMWRCSNVERWRDKGHTKVACDMDYLLMALGVPNDQRPGHGANQAYGMLLEQKVNTQFTAEAQISYYSNKNRQIYAEFPDQSGGTNVQEVPGVFGNGTRMYQSMVTRDANGKYPTTIPIQITVDDAANPGNKLVYTQIVRGFNDLTNLRP